MTTMTATTRTALSQIHRQDGAYLASALQKVAQGDGAAAAELAAKTGLSPAEVQAAAALALDKGIDAMFAGAGDERTQSTTGADATPVFHPADGGSDGAAGVAKLRGGGGKSDDVTKLATNGKAQDFSAHAQRSAPVFGAAAKSPLAAVPSTRDLLAVRSGDVAPEKVAAALKEALLSPNPAAVKKAARTLQVYESYRRKADADEQNFKNTGFKAFRFPVLDIKVDAADGKKLLAAVAATRDAGTADIVAMLIGRGILKFSPQERSGFDDKALKKLGDGKSGQLAHSDGREAPRGGLTSFFDEWRLEVAPGMDNIKKAIVETAAARGATCPFARGNHAKGVEFGDATLKTAADAPEWVKDLFGDVVKGGMVRVSMSTTNPDEPDQKNQQQPGVRVVLPLTGSLADGSAKQLLDITANAGDHTHAVTARRHTEFTEALTVAPKGLLDNDPVRLAKFLAGGATSGQLGERAWEIKEALAVANLAKKQSLDEHELFGRHAYFIGGRYVQFRLKVIEPKFPNPAHDARPNAREDVVKETVAKQGMKVAMFITEIPEGKPWLAEEEGWQGLASTEYLAGTFEVPAQSASSSSTAAQWFHEHTFAQHDDLLAQPVGLGRHRIPAYAASQEQRLKAR